MKNKPKKHRKQTTEEMYQTLNTVINNTYEKLIEKTLIKVNNLYVLNNRYAIDKKSNHTLVTRRRDMSNFKFFNTKLALTWSVLDYNKLFYEADRLIILDSLITSVDLEQQIHERLRHRDAIIYSNKIQQDRDRLKKYNLEINKYIRLANKLQNKELQK
jgi:hypothetical protein